MRDNRLEDAFPSLLSETARDGMRHSIRPRTKGHEIEAVPVTQPDGERVYQIKRRLSEKRIIEVADEAKPDETRSAAESIPEAPALPSVVAEPGLPRWHQLHKIAASARLGRGPSLPVVDAERESVTVRAFDLLRTRLRQVTMERGWTRIAVCAPTTGCGTTFTAVNLALSLSRIASSRTLLMDLNLRNPGVGEALDMRAKSSMQDFLRARVSITAHIARVSDTLALGLNNMADFNAADTLQAPETGLTLERMRASLQPELTIYDMPAMLAHDDVAAFLPHVDAVLLVSDGTQTMAKHLAECERLLEDRVPLLGVVLNRARSDSIARYA
ncbi:MAG: exopolysaccharide biosynthesis protein [Pseudomonadota bacterium]